MSPKHPQRPLGTAELTDTGRQRAVTEAATTAATRAAAAVVERVVEQMEEKSTAHDTKSEGERPITRNELRLAFFDHTGGCAAAKAYLRLTGILGFFTLIVGALIWWGNNSVEASISKKVTQEFDRRIPELRASLQGFSLKAEEPISSPAFQGLFPALGKLVLQKSAFASPK